MNEQPANLRVLSLSTSGDGAVLADNAEVINGLLADYNEGVPGGNGAPGIDLTSFSSKGGCSLSTGRRAPVPVPLALGFVALLGAGWLRRRATQAR